jgi:hypothetical protein
MKNYGVQNYQTGLVEYTFEKEIDAIQKCHELNEKYAYSREDLKDFKTVYIIDNKVYDSERDYLNS